MVLSAAPKLPVTVGVKVSSANIGEFVIIRNLTNGEQLTGKLEGTDRSIVFNPAPSAQWEDGHVVQAEIRGRLAGVAQKTIKSRTVQFKTTDLAAVTDTSTAGVSL